VAFRGPLGHALEADPLQLPGDGVVDLSEWAGLDIGDLVQQFGAGIAPERAPASELLVKDHTQAEDVGPAIDPVALAAGLLGAHVGRRPGEALLLAHVVLL